MGLFQESTTQSYPSGAAETPAPVYVSTQPAGAVQAGNGWRLEFRATGTDTQTGTIAPELNHVELASFDIAGAGGEVVADLLLLRTGATQGVLRGMIVTNGTAEPFAEVAINGLAWDRPQQFRMVAESDEDGGVTLRNLGIQR